MKIYTEDNESNWIKVNGEDSSHVLVGVRDEDEHYTRVYLNKSEAIQVADALYEYFGKDTPARTSESWEDQLK